MGALAGAPGTAGVRLSSEGAVRPVPQAPPIKPDAEAVTTDASDDARYFSAGLRVCVGPHIVVRLDELLAWVKATWHDCFVSDGYGCTETAGILTTTTNRER